MTRFVVRTLLLVFVFVPGAFSFGAEPCEGLEGHHRLFYRPEWAPVSQEAFPVDFTFQANGDFQVINRFFDEVLYLNFSLVKARFTFANPGQKVRFDFFCENSFEDCERIRDDARGYRETLLNNNYVDAQEAGSVAANSQINEYRQKILACATALLQDVALRVR